MQITTSTSSDLDAMSVELNKATFIDIYVAFTTTGATVVAMLPSNFRRFRVSGVCWAGACASDETLAVDSSVHTIGSDGVHTGTVAGTGYSVQFIRTGSSKTSGLGFFAHVRAVP